MCRMGIYERQVLVRDPFDVADGWRRLSAR
jgi:hypothetical protein